MSKPKDAALDLQLAQLQEASLPDADGLLHRVTRQATRHRRSAVASLVGVAVAILGTVVFTLRGDPFGYLALSGTALVIALTAWRHFRSAEQLAQLSGPAALEAWRAELIRDLRQGPQALIITGLFAALTAWVVLRHGLMPKSMLYVATAVVLLWHALHQMLVRRPLLKRELNLLDEH